MTDEKLEEKVAEPVEKITVKVRDGVAFQFVSTIKNGMGMYETFTPKPPALSGEVIEIEPNQALGQEQKLMRMEPVTLACINSTCKNVYETDAYDIRKARCPKCGAQGGVIVETKKKKKKRTAKDKPKVKETNRMDKKDEILRDDKLETIIPDPPKGSVKTAKKTKKKTDKKKK